MRAGLYEVPAVRTVAAADPSMMPQGIGSYWFYRQSSRPDVVPENFVFADSDVIPHHSVINSGRPDQSQQ